MVSTDTTMKFISLLLVVQDIFGYHSCNILLKLLNSLAVGARLVSTAVKLPHL